MSLALERLPEDVRMQARSAAAKLHKSQERAFGQVAGPPDVPGERDEAQFSTRVSKLNAAKPACPLLFDELCSIYTSRPLLCRAYGFPVDAYAVRGGDALVFRSLCVLYEGMQLNDYVRARDLKGQLTDLSVRMAGGRDWRRFTSVEAVSGQILRR
jgi:Fe-S-cluster containining protein